MRDNHRPKQDLIHEVIGLRKQVLDLKEAMVARRRVEQALREAEFRLHLLLDSAPVGLCLFLNDGTPLAANTRFARMLGYDSPAELQRIGGVRGIFATAEERARVLGRETASRSGALFRHKDGRRLCLSAVAAACPEHDSVALVVYQELTEQ